MSADFTKVYRGFFEGSLRDESPYSKLLFLAMLLHADENGVVLGSVSFWADYVKCSQDEVRESLKVLSSPDPDSTTTDCDGRRIEPWGEGANRWRIVNYRKYYERSRNEERREYKAEWMRAKRGQVWTEVDSVDPENERKTKTKTKGKEKEARGAIGVVSLLGYDSLKDIASKYDTLRKQKGLSLWKPVTVDLKVKEWSEFTEQEIGRAIYESVSNEWRGVFPKKQEVAQYDRV